MFDTTGNFGHNINKPASSETSILTMVSSTNGSSASTCTSHENSFVQLNNKLLNRGIQTEHIELSSITTLPNSNTKLNSLHSSRVDSTNLLKENNNNSNIKNSHKTNNSK
jgi:hypothetical protein